MRLTYSRDGRHPGADPMFRIALVAGILASFPLAFAATLFLLGVSGAVASAILVGASIGAVCVRGAILAADRFIRPMVFDREQRNQEIVPSRYAIEEHSHHG